MNTTEQFIFEQHMKNLDTRWEDFAREIMSLQTPDTFSILYATDVHYIRKYAISAAAYYKVREMTEFSEYIGMDLLALTGDLVDGNTTIKRQYRDLYDLVSLVRKAKTTSVLISKGNHDDCSWYAYNNRLDASNWLSCEDWYTHVINPIRVQYPIVLDEENIAGGYYYIDYPLHKIRVININTSDNTTSVNSSGLIDKEYCGHWRFGITENQLKWLTKALTFREEGWSVLIMSHEFLIPYNETEGIVHNGEAAWDMLKAYKNNGKGEINSEDINFKAMLTYDFTKNRSNDILLYMFGHVHRDMHFVHDGITAVSSKNILGNTQKEWDNTDVKADGGWDCVLIDKKARMFNSRRFGVPEENRDIKF